MTAPLLAHVEEAMAKATPGPWQLDDDGSEVQVTAGTARGFPGSWQSTDLIHRHDIGEWSGETEGDAEQRRADAAAIVAAVNAAPKMVAALRAVAALHVATEPEDSDVRWCGECCHTWPCVTVRDIRAALGDLA